MHKSHLLSSIADELIIHKYGNGVKLARPVETTAFTSIPHKRHTIGQTSALAFSFCLLNCDSEIMRMNTSGAELNGYASEKDVVGKSLFDIFETNNANELRKHDLAILNSPQTCMSVNKTTRKDGEQFNNLIIDAPCYSEDDLLIGILGFSVVIGTQPIEPALNYLREIGLLETTSHRIINGIQLTKREKECLDHLMHGKSYKQIAITLKLSPRTVEHCVERVKIKFGVRTKFQLIDLLQRHY